MSFQAEKFPLPFEGQEYLGHIAYPLDTTEKRPLIIVCPNYAVRSIAAGGRPAPRQPVPPFMRRTHPQIHSCCR